MPIAQVPSTIIIDPRQYLHLIYGEPGIGKTTWAKQIPGHYFLQTEIGTKSLAVFASPVFTWEEFILECTEIVEQKQAQWTDKAGKAVREIQTLVIDTLDNLFAYAADFICRTSTFPEKGIQHRFSRIEDVPFGKGYKRARQLIVATLDKLALYGFGIVMLAHDKDRLITWRGQELTKASLDLPPSVVTSLIAACDVVGYFALEQQVRKDETGRIIIAEEVRQAFWQRNFLRETKHRLDDFPDVTILNKDTMFADYLSVFRETALKIDSVEVSGESVLPNTPTQQHDNVEQYHET